MTIVNVLACRVRQSKISGLSFVDLGALGGERFREWAH